MSKKTVKRVLRSGKHWGFKNGERHCYVKGDTVELTEVELNSFRNKFEVPQVAEVKEVKEAPKEEPAKETPKEQPKAPGQSGAPKVGGK